MTSPPGWTCIELRQLGIRIAIDDFGTGYSALSYLRQVPLDIIKLDRTFIQHMTVSAQQRELVEGIVNLTRTLGLQVVAEGIETHVELQLARQVGCDYGQGYLFSKPMPVDDARNWLDQPERDPSRSMAQTSSISRGQTAAPVRSLGPAP